MAKVLAIITARGGSKTVPRKNVRPFCGKPLIEWTILSAKAAHKLDRIIVSTDDAEIAEISKAAGAEVPFMRPAELALDSTPSLPVLQHALRWFNEKESYAPEYTLLLQPTSPGRQAFHIEESIERIEQTKSDSVISLSEVPAIHNYRWQIALDEDRAHLVDGAAWAQVIPRRQELETTYVRNGLIYLSKSSLFFTEPASLYGINVSGYITDEKYSMEIDTEKEWADAESKFVKLLDEQAS